MVGLSLLVVFSVMAAVPGLLAPDSPSAEVFLPGQQPSLAHIFGTTSYGQDILSQFIWGTRTSLVIAVVAGLLGTVLSVLGSVPRAV
jgi:peptide/nickel transport system permease protein